MEDRPKVTIEQVRLMAETLGLHVPHQDLEKLASDYSKFLVGFGGVRKLETSGQRSANTVPCQHLG